MKEVEVNYKSYRIMVDDLQFTLYERKVGKKKSTGEEYEKMEVVGYFHGLEGCLKRMIRQESSKHGDVFELREYIDLWRYLVDDLKEHLSEELSVLTV